MKVLLFFVNLLKPKNFSALLYLLMNLGVTYLFALGFCLISPIKNNDLAHSALYASFVLVVFAVFIFLALTPLGEVFLRTEYNLKEIKRKPNNRAFYQMIDTVLDSALIKYRHIGRNIKFFIIDDESINAFALGSRTIAFTKGMMSMSPEYIKGFVAHEIGHIKNYDSFLNIMSLVGNVFVTIVLYTFYLLILGITVLLILIFVGGSSRRCDNGACSQAISNANKTLSLGFTKVRYTWSRFGLKLISKTLRESEYLADDFACEIGFGINLGDGLDFLDNLMEKDKEEAPLFMRMVQTHPDTSLRVMRIKNNLHLMKTKVAMSYT